MTANASPRAMFYASASAPALLRGAQAAYAADDGAGGGGLSIDAAIALLDKAEDEPAGGSAAAAHGQGSGEASEGAQGGPEGQQTGSEGEASSPNDAAGAAENQPEGASEAEAGEGAVALLGPPKYWSQDAKARFAELSPDLQAVVLAQEGPREEAAAKAKAEAAEVRAKADKDLSDVQKLAERLNVIVPQVLQNFRNRWGDAPDWVAVAREHGADKMAVAKAQWEADQAQVRELQQAAAAAGATAHQEYVRTEFEKLKTLDPQPTDPKDGPQLRADIARYLDETHKIPVAAVANISAAEMTIARKAMLWDQAQAKAAKATPPPKPAAAQTKPLARGAASAGPTDPKAKQVQTSRNRFAQTRSIEDAVALLNSMEE